MLYLPWLDITRRDHFHPWTHPLCYPFTLGELEVRGDEEVVTAKLLGG